MQKESILLYQGPLSGNIIGRLLSEFKHSARNSDIPFGSYKKMISIMIEALENICKYSDHLPLCNGTDEYEPVLHIQRSGRFIELMTQNPVRTEHVAELRARIDRVNEKSKEELRHLYKTTICDGQFTPKGGAGLGFIEMAKTSKNKLEYQFSELSNDYALYTFRVSFPW